jgi:hypothetical protein
VICVLFLAVVCMASYIINPRNLGIGVPKLRIFAFCLTKMACCKESALAMVQRGQLFAQTRHDPVSL